MRLVLHNVTSAMPMGERLCVSRKGGRDGGTVWPRLVLAVYGLIFQHLRVLEWAKLEPRMYLGWMSAAIFAV